MHSQALMKPAKQVERSNYSSARKVITTALGRDTIARLHRPISLLDWIVVIALPITFVVNAVALAVWSSWLWPLLFILQGCLIQIFGYVVHDLFVHRRHAGSAGYYIGAVLELPLATRRTWYARYHIDHHNLMNTEDDPEAYKQDLDSRLKRLAFLTLPGAILTMARLLKPATPEYSNVSMGPLTPPSDDRTRWQIRFESRLAILGSGGLAVGIIVWPGFFIFGYILPLIIVTPIVSSLRVVLEHADCDPDNVFHCATFYRTGLVTGPLFFWDAGDCHIVHHIYPAIPFYRMPAAVNAIAPILREHGARERQSLTGLLYAWFVRNERHRTVWSIPR